MEMFNILAGDSDVPGRWWKPCIVSSNPHEDYPGLRNKFVDHSILNCT